MSVVFYVLEAVVFLLAGFDVPLGAVSQLGLVAFGLASFAIAHVLP